MFTAYEQSKLEETGHRVLEETEDHVDTDAVVAWKFGVSLICGFLLPVLSSFVFPHIHDPELCQNCERELKPEFVSLKVQGTAVAAISKEVPCDDICCQHPKNENSNEETLRRFDGERDEICDFAHCEHSRNFDVDDDGDSDDYNGPCCDNSDDKNEHHEDSLSDRDQHTQGPYCEDDLREGMNLRHVPAIVIFFTRIEFVTQSCLL